MSQQSPFSPGNPNNQPPQNQPPRNTPPAQAYVPQNSPTVPVSQGMPRPGGYVPPMRLRLRFLEGPRAGELLELPMPVFNGPTLSVGRVPECDIRIDSGDISRRHSEILAGSRGELLVRDLGSVNQTLLNGQPLVANVPTPLYPGMRLQMGHTIILYEGATGQLPSTPTNYQATSIVSTNPPRPTAAPATPIPNRPTTSPLAGAVGAEDDVYYYIFLKSGQRYLFKGDEAIVGRGPASDIVIDNNSISRAHARLQRTPNGIYLSDLGSTNKTTVNGVSADVPILLHDGDILRFGDIEADFKIEDSRLSVVFDVKKLREMVQEQDSTTTEEEIPDRTLIEMQTMFENNGGFGQAAKSVRDSRLEEGETSLNIKLNDVVVVGRNQRNRSAALPENTPGAARYYQSGSDQTRFTATPQRNGPEVARMEGVFYTEGTGRNATLILNDVKLGLRQGELVALVGPSGSGKSELLQIMAGKLAADKGRTLVLNTLLPTLESTGNRRRPSLEEDRDISRWRARHIGYTTSDLNQLNPRLTVLEQVTQVLEMTGILHDPRQRQDIALQRLEKAGITDGEVLRLRPPDLTRREKHLVALARALANDPPIIMADEPLGNLHSKDASFVFELLQQLVATGKTVFMVTQDQTWARLAHRQIEILDGEIIGGLS